MKTIILHNIVSNNSVYKLSSFIKKNKSELGRIEVWFCGETESNRKWSLQEEINFDYELLKNRKVELWGNDLFTYFINWNIWQKLNKANPDKLIINGWDQFAYQIAFIWGWIHKKHITLWSGSTKYEKSWRRTLTKPLVRFFVAISNNYIAYGTRAKKYLISLGADENKIKIFLNDVNKDYFTSQAKKLAPQKTRLKRKFGVSAKYNLLFVGQFIERKGVLELLHTYKSLKQIHQDWGLIIVGYGPLKNTIAQTIETHNLKDAILLGHIDQYDLPKIYAISDILVLPSKEEVWGLVVNEALYSDLKVVVSNICGCSDDFKTNNSVFIYYETSE